MKQLNWILILSFFTFSAFAAKVAGKMVAYKEKETQLEGYIAEPTSAKKQVPGFLIVHD